MQLLGAVGSGWSGERVVHQEPSVATCLLDISVAYESEGEIETWREGSHARALTKHIAYHRLESRQRHGILVAIAQADIAHHHEHACHRLRRAIPALVVERFLSRHGYLELQRRVYLIHYAYTVVVETTIAQAERLAVFGLGADYQSASLTAMRHLERGVGHEGYLLLVSPLVLRQLSA